MTITIHERAIELSAKALVTDLSDSEQIWLNKHVAGCPGCAAEIDARTVMLHGMKTMPILADESLVLNTQLRVRERCVQMRLKETRLAPVWISCALASAWMLFSTPYLWQTFDSIGHWLKIPDLLWQMGFLTTWFMPAVSGAVVAFWLRPKLISRVPDAPPVSPNLLASS